MKTVLEAVLIILAIIAFVASYGANTEHKSNMSASLSVLFIILAMVCQMVL